MRLGILVAPGYGHITPLRALADSLRDCGHEIIFFAVADGIARLGEIPPGMSAVEVGNYPPGAVNEIERKLASLRGVKAMRQMSVQLADNCRAFVKDAPALIEAKKIDALIIDQVLIVGETIARATKRPFITVATTITLNPHPDIPPVCTTWKYRRNFLAKIRNVVGNLYAILYLAGPFRPVIEAYRKSLGYEYGPFKTKFNARTNSKYAYINSRIAVILNYPRSLELPNPEIEDYFFFAGHLSPRTAIHAPAEVPIFPDDYVDLPLIYVSLGTVRNGSLDLYRKILEACKPLKVRLLITMGGNLDPEILKPLPPNVKAVKFAPQKQVLQEAVAFITHAGMNSVLESVTAHTPLIFLPQADDQGGVSVRGEAAGIGLRAREKPSAIRRALVRVLEDPQFQTNVQKMAADIAAAGGAPAAAELIATKLAAISQPKSAKPNC